MDVRFLLSPKYRNTASCFHGLFFAFFIQRRRFLFDDRHNIHQCLSPTDLDPPAAFCRRHCLSLSLCQTAVIAQIPSAGTAPFLLYFCQIRRRTVSHHFYAYDVRNHALSVVYTDHLRPLGHILGTAVSARIDHDRRGQPCGRADLPTVSGPVPSALRERSC